MNPDPVAPPVVPPDPVVPPGGSPVDRATRSWLPARLRHLMPRTFQARLTLAFVGVIALTLSLVGILVVNRLDDYFTSQQIADLRVRTETVGAYVRGVANRTVAEDRGQPVVGRDGMLDQAVVDVFDDPTQRLVIADQLGQADVGIRFGFETSNGETSLFVPSPNGAFLLPLEAPPAKGQTQEHLSEQDRFAGGPVDARYEVEITLQNPYTYRATAIANVTGLLAAITLFALGLAVVVSAALARRFTTPLRQLTETSRALAEGDLARRVPASQLLAGSSELGELAVQFNAMAARLEESVEISRRDRDRSRDFLADVSHELRTPLAALRTFNQLLMERAGDDPEARAEFLESSAGQIERLDWLAQNLLELSKLDSGLVLLDLRPDDLRAAVKSATHQNDAVAARRGVTTLTVALPPTPVRIRHDPPRIGQVVSNLVANAIKFTPRGGSVRVTVGSTATGALIEVADTGIGIDRAELPHIFERFYRGSRSNEARSSGSGLGLAIVRSIVEMHGGSISVESGPGAGSRFTVLLPADPRTVAGTPAAARAAVATAAEGDRRMAGDSPPTPGNPPEDGEPNMTETSPSDASQMNPASAP